MRVFVVLLLVGVALALRDVPAPELLQAQSQRISTLLVAGEKSCSDDISALQQELNKHQLVITRYQQQMQSVNVTYQLSQQQLQAQLSAIEQVQTMIQSVISGTSSASSTSSTTAAINALDQSSPKMAGVLRNIVASVSEADEGTPVSIDMSQVTTLISQLEANIQSAMQTSSITQEEQSYNEHISIEQAIVEQLNQKIINATAQCNQDQNDLTQVLSVIKVIEQNFQNTSVPDCSSFVNTSSQTVQTLTQQNQVLQQQLDDAKKQIEALTCKLEAVESSTASSASSTTSSTSTTTTTQCTAQIQQLETINQQSQSTIQSLQQQLVKSVSQKTSFEAKYTETSQELQRVQSLAQCTDDRALIQRLEHRIHQLSIKSELGEKCAVNFKSLQIEKNELLKQLEKMSVINSQLDSCKYQAAKSAQECSQSYEEKLAAQNAVISKLTEENQLTQTQLTQYQQSSQCSSERSVIEKYEKDIVSVKTETRTVVTEIESEARGCKAELDTLNAKRAEDEVKINDAYTQVCNLQQQLAVLQSDHDQCVQSTSGHGSAYKALQAELLTCRSDLKIVTTKIEGEHALLTKLRHEKDSAIAHIKAVEEEEATLKAEIKTMTEKIANDETKVLSLSQEVSQQEQAEQKTKETVSTYAHQLEQQNNKLAEVQERITAAEASLAAEKSGNHELMRELKNLQSHQQALQKAKVAAEAEYEKAKSDYARTREFRAAAFKHLHEARAAIEASDKRVDELNERLRHVAHRKDVLSSKLHACEASNHHAEETLHATKEELSQCHHHVASLQHKLETGHDDSHEEEYLKEKLRCEQEALKEEREECHRRRREHYRHHRSSDCSAHQATIAELKKHGYALRVELRGTRALKDQLGRKVANLESKLHAWKELNNKLQSELRSCSDGHAGCHSSVRALKNQLLSNYRRIKHHVSSIARLEERLAASQTELSHTRKQWHHDRAAYKHFKDNLLVQMAKLISLAKDAKRKFDVARAAGKNEFKVQDAQWGVCRKEVLNYERILGAGVVKSEREKMKSYLASKKYHAAKSSAESALQNAQLQSGTNADTREHSKAEVATHALLEKMGKQASKLQ